MSPDDFGKLTLGEDYEIDRWTDGTIDEDTHVLNWYDGRPVGSEWGEVHMLTVDYNAYKEGAEPDYRNLTVNPDRPLDRWESETSEYGPEPYDVDDLVTGWSIVSP